MYTDNISVKWLKQIKNCQGRLGRWALSLQGYNFQVIHKSGTANGNADGLSRRKYPANEPERQQSQCDFDDIEKAVDNINCAKDTDELAAVTLSQFLGEPYLKIFEHTSPMSCRILKSRERLLQRTFSRPKTSTRHSMTRGQTPLHFNQQTEFGYSVQKSP